MTSHQIMVEAKYTGDCLHADNPQLLDLRRRRISLLILSCRFFDGLENRNLTTLDIDSFASTVK